MLPDGARDATTQVAWLQGRSFFGDLRQTPGRPDMAGAAALSDLSAGQLAWLATQEGFAGVLAEDADCVAWSRRIDFQPPSSSPDVARVRFEDDTLVEAGRDVPYVEYWSRDAEPPEAACWGASLRDERTGAAAWLVRAGAWFMVARARPDPLPLDARLTDLVGGAESLAEMRALVDCELSLGRVGREGWRVERSTLPFLEGRAEPVDIGGGRLLLGARGAFAIETIEGDPFFA